MCDWASWIEKDGKLYFLRDDDIEAKWPNADFKDKIGHSAIEEFYPESKGGKHIESPTKIPSEIAAEVGRGRMDKMIHSGGWAGARYSKAGNLNSAWWKKVQKIIKEVKNIKYFSNEGEINPDWKIFDTISAAFAAADSAAFAAAFAADRSAARSVAYAVADSAAFAAAFAAARSAARSVAYAAAYSAAYEATYEAAFAAARSAADSAADSAAYSAARSAADSAASLAADSAASLARCEIIEFLDDNQFKIHAQKRMDVWHAGYGLLCDVDGMLYVYKKP